MSHVQDVNMGYWKHFRRAMDLAATMQLGAATAVIHAFIPEAFKTETSDIIDRLYKNLKEKPETSE